MERKEKLKFVKILMHEEYNHELSKHHSRRRWVKESKRFYWKRKRKKMKGRLQSEDCIG